MEKEFNFLSCRLGDAVFVNNAPTIRKYVGFHAYRQTDEQNEVIGRMAWLIKASIRDRILELRNEQNSKIANS